MKRFFLAAAACVLFISSSAQISSSIGNAFEDGFSIAEIEKIFTGASYSDHKKWMKQQGYDYNESESTSKYFFYNKNDVVRFALYHNGKKITQVLAVASPQKYYQAVEDVLKDKSFRLVEEEIQDKGGGKFVNSAKWVKNGNIIDATTDGYTITIYRDIKGLSAKPTIKSFEERPRWVKDIEDLQDELYDIGPVYPHDGYYYKGVEKLVQRVDADGETGNISVTKSRTPKSNDCKTGSSFYMEELVTIPAKNIISTQIYEYKPSEGLSPTYALCLIVKNWRETGDRKYKFLQAYTSGKCYFPDKWDTGTKTNPYITPLSDCAVALEFTSRKQADKVKAIFDKAIAGAKK